MSDMPDAIVGLLPDRDDGLTGSCPCGCGITFIGGVDARRTSMFHLRDGFCFGRNSDGSVTVRVLTGGLADADVLAEVTVPDNEWASVLASTCARGETGETYAEATKFLTEEASPDQVPSSRPPGSATPGPGSPESSLLEPGTAIAGLTGTAGRSCDPLPYDEGPPGSEVLSDERKTD